MSHGTIDVKLNDIRINGYFPGSTIFAPGGKLLPPLLLGPAWNGSIKQEVKYLTGKGLNLLRISQINGVDKINCRLIKFLKIGYGPAKVVRFGLCQFACLFCPHAVLDELL